MKSIFFMGNYFATVYRFCRDKSGGLVHQKLPADTSQQEGLKHQRLGGLAFE